MLPSYAFLALSIILTVLSQIAQKQVAILYVSRSGTHYSRLRFYFAQPVFWFAMICLFAAMLSWLRVLESMEVGKAYPMLSINYIVILLASRFIFAEAIPITRWLGVAFIVAGIIFIAGT